MMVDAGEFIPHKVGHIPGVLLGVHTDDLIRLLQLRDQVFVGKHPDLEGVQHLGGAQLIDLPVIAKDRRHPVLLQQLLEPIGGGDGVRVRKVVGLDINGVPLAQPDQIVYMVSSCAMLLSSP